MVERGIRETFRMTGQRRISGSAFIANRECISPRTAWASTAAIIQRWPTLQQMNQQNHLLRLLGLAPLWSRTIGWQLALILHPAIGSSIGDAPLTSLAIYQCLADTRNILWRWRRGRETMASYHLHPDMAVLGWFINSQMERLKQLYFKKWCMCWDCSISSHSVRSWTKTSKSKQWITMVWTSTIAMASRLPLHLTLMGYSCWMEHWIRLQNRLNTPISTMTAACWHLRPLGMHLGTIQSSWWYGTAACHKLVWKFWRSRPMITDAPTSANTKFPSLDLFGLLYPQTQKNEIEVSLQYGIALLFQSVSWVVAMLC